jgi:hypothetical protein
MSSLYVPCIYAICHPDDEQTVYIGRTISAFYRFNQHWNNKEDTLIGNWVRKIKIDGKAPIFKLIEQFERNNFPSQQLLIHHLCLREKFWIDVFTKEMGYNLLNMACGVKPTFKNDYCTASRIS